jgi:hypothetical protein
MHIGQKAAILVALALGPVGSTAQMQGPLSVSLVQLIATPERFDGKMVAVTGFLTIGHEATFLYLSEADYEHALPENAVSFELTREMLDDREKLNRSYVVLVGVFRANRRAGYTYPCPNGAVTKITRFSQWTTTNEPMGNERARPNR